MSADPGYTPDPATVELINHAWRTAPCPVCGRAVACRCRIADDDQRKYRARAVLAALAAAGRLRAPVLFEVERWKVDLPQGSVKGIAESDARRLAAEHGGTASRSVVRLLTDEKEELDSWQKVSGS